MKKNQLQVIFIILILLSLPFFTTSMIWAQENSPDKYIVKYRKQISDKERSQIRQGLSSRLVSRIEKLNADVVMVENIPKTTLRRFRIDPRIEYVETDYLAYTYEMSNDPGIQNNLQWGLIKIKMAGNPESGWNITHGNSQVKVAIIDTGIDRDHQDLKNKIQGEKNCTDTTSLDDLYGHGTHVAGIVAAQTNNGIGAASAGYNVSLLNAKALGDNGSGYYSWIASCVVWAADQGAKVINMSLGGTNSSRLLEEAINYAYSKGVVLVAAAGNNGQSAPSYPAAYQNVLSVAATDINDNKASFSNFGDWVDVAAPGVNIYSTLPNHFNAFKKYNYGYLSGTSMAAPFVSGLASLLFSVNNKTKDEVVGLIENYADKISGTATYWKYGRINAYQSLREALLYIPEQISPTLILMPVPTSTPTIAPSLTPTITPIPTIVVPTLTPTLIPTNTPTILMTITPTLAPINNPRNRVCIRFPKLCN